MITDEKSIEMVSSDVNVLVSLLSPERMKALTDLTGSIEKAIELHQETLRLGSALMNVIATIEIALRNLVCLCLEKHFGVSNWLSQPPVAFPWKELKQVKIRLALDSARRASYSKLSQTEKSALDILAYPAGRPHNIPHLKRSKDRRRLLSVTEGKIVAELTLYFWKRLYSPL